LKLRIEQCDSKLPDGIAVYVTAPHAEPDLDAWRQTLGVGLYIAGAWDWRKAAAADSAPIAQSSGHTRALSRVAAKLRPAAWMAGAALAIHAFALAGDWALVAGEQHALRRQMETRFRSVFPEAVAVVDPALQMRRKLAETRHSAHRTDEADFAPLIGHAAAALNDSAPGAVRLVTYDRGRLTLHLAPGASALARRTAVRLREAGLIVEMTPVSPNAADHAVALTIGPS
jgi:general secretion pathway protein L